MCIIKITRRDQIDSFKDSKINVFENVSQLKGKAKLIEVPKNEDKFTMQYIADTLNRLIKLKKNIF